MSASIVSARHIGYQIAAAQLYGRPTFHYSRDPKLDYLSLEQAQAAGQMPWDENHRSVSCRYGGDHVFDLYHHESNRPAWDMLTAIQVLKACDCYEYESCEHLSWEKSDAKAFIEELRRLAWQKLPGYEQAKWAI